MSECGHENAGSLGSHVVCVSCGAEWDCAEIERLHIHGEPWPSVAIARYEAAQATAERTITDEQLSQIVTGLPLGGGVIEARKKAASSSYRPGGHRVCRDGGACTEAEDDRLLLRQALEEARDEGRLRVNPHGLVIITGPQGIVSPYLADLRAALPGFDWSGVSGYEGPEPDCLACGDVCLTSVGTACPKCTSEPSSESAAPALPGGGEEVDAQPSLSAAQDPQPFDPWPLTEREVRSLTVAALNQWEDLPVGKWAVQLVRARARHLAQAMFHFDALDTEGRAAEYRRLKPSLLVSDEVDDILRVADWRWRTEFRWWTA